MEISNLPARTKEIDPTGNYDLDTMKVLIVSTAKTGNTWVKHLLGQIYDLPILAPTTNLEFLVNSQDARRWITQIHFDYDLNIAEWARKNQVILVTTVRHPADTLISLFHYYEKCPEDFPAQLMTYLFFKNGKPQVDLQFGMAPEKLDYSIEFVKHYFPGQLIISLDWLESGESNVIRYEDLWRDPLTALQNLTDKLHPVPAEQLHRAIEQCDIKMLREVVGKPQFFRNGRPGDWTREMAPELVEVLKNFEPYPTMFAKLGYNLDPHDPQITAPAKPFSFTNPFQKVSHFDNGVIVAPIIARLYQSVEPDLLEQWGPVASTEPGNSFYSWLNAPTELDPHREEGLPLISNLSVSIYKIRTDYQTVFSDLFGRNRLDYILWFRSRVRTEYHLADAFVNPVLESLLNWATLNHEPEDHSPLIISRLAAYIYRSRPDLQKLYPDFAAKDRGPFLLWVLLYAPEAYGLGSEYFKPVKDSFQIWSGQETEEYPALGEDAPALTNLYASIYHSRPDYQAAFPDLFKASDRSNFIGWFSENGITDYKQLDWIKD